MSGDEANLAAVEEGNTGLEELLAASHISEDRETAHGNEKPDGVRDESALDSLADGDGSGVKEIHAPAAEVQEVSRKVDAGHFDGGESARQDRGGERSAGGSGDGAVGGLAVSSAGLSQAELSDLDPRKLGVPAHRSEDSEAPRWRRRKKHTFIVSSAGKPIFTRYGDEDALNPLFGVMCSLVSFFVEGEDDTPRAVLAGDHRVVFLIRGPVYLIMVSRTKEPTAHLARQLQFVYTQLVSILTRKGLERVFKKRHGFDLRNLLGSSGEQVLSNLVGAMDAHKLASALPLHSAISFVFGAPHCARLPLAVRSQVNRALLSVRSPNLIYAILLARTQLVQFVRPRKTALWAEDLLLVVNLVNSSSSFRESDGTWTPLCLPLYSPDANVFAYIGFLHKHEAPDVCLVLVTSSDDEFGVLAESKDKIADALHSSGALARIQEAANQPPFLVEELQAAPFSISRELLHFVYFSTSMNQFIAPGFSPPFWTRQVRQRLLRQYQAVSHWVHRQQTRVQHKVLLVSWETEAVFAWVDRDCELYLALDPLTSRAAALAICNKLLRWVRAQEAALFITPQMW